MKIAIGMPYSFRPTAFAAAEHDGLRTAPVLHGKVVYINREHGYFVAEAEVNGYTLRESFPCAPVSKLANSAKIQHGYH